jgi:4'-phosphopantetheinyl transferase
MTAGDEDGWPVVDRAPPLTVDEVHVWRAGLLCADAALAEFESILTNQELARADRFVNPRDRRRFAVARGCLRRLLGEYSGTPPAKVALSATELGKPYLADPAADLRFNVAHSDELALFAFSRAREIGVDIEWERPEVNWQELARRYVAPEEYGALIADDCTFDRRAAFFRCWARKEAYVKALGLGLQVPLDGFAVTIGPEAPAILHTAHDPGQRNCWALRDLPAIPGFAAALVVESPGPRLRCIRHAGFP